MVNVRRVVLLSFCLFLNLACLYSYGIYAESHLKRIDSETFEFQDKDCFEFGKFEASKMKAPCIQEGVGRLKVISHSFLEPKTSNEYADIECNNLIPLKRLLSADELRDLVGQISDSMRTCFWVFAIESGWFTSRRLIKVFDGNRIIDEDQIKNSKCKHIYSACVGIESLKKKK